MSMKRTRPIRGKYFLISPRVAHGGRIISLKMKISSVTIEDHGPAKSSTPKSEQVEEIVAVVGEIERGSVDGEE